MSDQQQDVEAEAPATSSKKGKAEEPVISFRAEKIKLKRSGGVFAIFSKVEFIKIGRERIPVVSQISQTLPLEPKPSFNQAKRNLICHLVRIMEEKGAEDKTLEDDLMDAQDNTKDSPFRFTNYYMEGVTVRDEGAALQGGRFLKSRQVVPLNTPLIRYGEVTESTYQHLVEFEQAIKLFVAEWNLYMNGNCLPPAQKVMDFQPETELEKAA